MFIREIYTFVTDSRNGQLLELNASEVADVRPLNKFRGGDIYSRNVFKYIKTLNSEPDLECMFAQGAGFSETIYMNVWAALDERKIKPIEYNGIIFPQFSNTGKSLDSMAIEFNYNNPQLCVVNASRTHQTVYRHKGILAEIAYDADCESLPLTFNYLHPRYNPHTPTDYIDHILQNFDGCEAVVLKPPAAYKGDGVAVIPYNQIANTLPKLLNGDFVDPRIIDSAAQNYWLNTALSMFQIQNYAEGTFVKHRKKDWSATTRIVWSVVIGENEHRQRDVVVTPHAGFYKFPRHSWKGHVTQDSTVSYSHGHNAIEGLAHIFKKAVFGSGAQIVITDEDVLRREAYPIKADLEKIFRHIDSMGYLTFIESFIQPHRDTYRNLVRLKLSDEMKHQYGEFPNRNFLVERMRGRVPPSEHVL